MSIQDLGSIGELIAAIATILTLAYLALQIRTSNKIAQAQSLRELTNPPISHSLLLAENPELAEIVQKGFSDFQSLSSLEQNRFHQWMMPLFAHIETVWRMHQMKLMIDAPLEGYLRVAVSILNTPGGADWWSFYRNVTNSEVVEMFDTAQRDIGHEVPPITEILPFLNAEQT